MNKLNIFTKTSLALTALLVGLMLGGSTTSALPYSGSTTQASPVPAFNVFTPTSGNTMPAPAPSKGEYDFFQGRVPANGDPNEGTTAFTDPVNAGACQDGQLIQLHIYVHNGASADANNGGSGPSVAHNTHVKVALPASQATSFKSDATITASNAATVNDNVTINCNGQAVKIQYIPGSASQYSAGSGVLKLSDAIVGAGVPIQSEHTPGDVWGCWNERVYVVLSVKVVKVPVTPTPATVACVALDKFTQTGRTVRVEEVKTAVTNNAKVNSYTIVWGDGQKSENVQLPVSHTYAKEGKYTVNAFVNATVEGKNVSVTAATCSKAINFATPPVTPPATPPTVLPNTGAGQVIGLFAATVVAGAAASRLFLSRRLNRQ